MFRSILSYGLTFSLSLAVAVPFLLHLGLYQQKVNQIRKEVKILFEAGIADHELEHFEWMQADYEALEWEEGGKEFLYHGFKYDVYSIQKEGNTVKVSAWLDHQESSLKKRFTKLLEKHHPKPNDKELHFFKVLKNQCLASAFQFIRFDLSQKSFRLMNDLGLGLSLTLDDPPPRFKF